MEKTATTIGLMRLFEPAEIAAAVKLAWKSGGRLSEKDPRSEDRRRATAALYASKQGESAQPLSVGEHVAFLFVE
jgi:hypothetical protein